MNDFYTEKNQDFHFLHDFGGKNLNFQKDKLWIFTEILARKNSKVFYEFLEGKIKI